MTNHTMNAQVASNLLLLPLESRHNIYPRVLFLRQPLFLFKETNSPVEAFAPRGKPRRWLSLLYTCRQVHREAKEFLYSTNKLIFVDSTPLQLDVVQSFLHTIGTTHSGHLHHLNINFPFTTGSTRSCSLQEGALDTLDLLQQQCPRLQTLDLTVHRDNFQGLADVQDEMGERSAKPVLDQIVQRLRSMESLTTVVIEFHSNRNAKVERLMWELGWEVQQGKFYR